MDEFAGDKKVGKSILGPIETKFKNWAVPKLPAWCETYHLTLMTLIWSALNLLWGYLAGIHSLHWLWMVSLMIVLQYVTDLFDGQLGRMKDTGLIKWGFFMDHFLDYVFLWSLVAAGYLISPPGLQFWYVVLLGVMGCFMVNSFLSFAATNEFEIFHFGIGPTETRIVFVIINTIIIYTGTAHFTWSLPTLVLVCLAALIFQVVRSSKKLWEIDEEEKGEKIPPPRPEKEEAPAEDSDEESDAEDEEEDEEDAEDQDLIETEADPDEESSEQDDEDDEPEEEKKPRKSTRKKTSGRKKTKKTESEDT